jgi:hypothetical protein
MGRGLVNRILGFAPQISALTRSDLRWRGVVRDSSPGLSTEDEQDGPARSAKSGKRRVAADLRAESGRVDEVPAPRPVPAGGPRGGRDSAPAGGGAWTAGARAVARRTQGMVFVAGHPSRAGAGCGAGHGLVGAERFELTTLCSQSRCATRLRYAPTERVIGRAGRFEKRVLGQTSRKGRRDRGRWRGAAAHRRARCPDGLPCRR